MCAYSLFESLQAIRDDENMLGHLELHAVRMRFIDLVMEYSLVDKQFAQLVSAQLVLYHNGYTDSRTFYDVCNAPRHMVRQRMLTWYIDHPGYPEGYKEEGEV